jgi:hypothetical protein
MQNLQHQGFTLIRGALKPPLLDRLRARFDDLLQRQAQQPARGAAKAGVTIELVRLFEVDPLFEALMDLPGIIELADRYVNGDVTLAQGGLGHVLLPHAPAHCGWHRDNGPWLRCTYLIDDVSEEQGPFTLLPGTHRAGNPPSWFNNGDGQPRDVPGMLPIVGAAGDCLLNDTCIWHTNTPNRTARPRKVIWVVYKPLKDAQWSGHDRLYCFTSEFAQRQTTERRRMLCREPELAAVS